MPGVLAVIPARYDAVRFPGKLVTAIAGKPLIVHTYERARQATLVDKTVVAIEDRRIADVLDAHGIPYLWTRTDHRTGTDRIAEVAAGEDADIVVNVQGDECLIDPDVIDEAIAALQAKPECAMSTARTFLRAPDAIDDPNVVKVVCGLGGEALYFSRYPIPFRRGSVDDGQEPVQHWQHIGLYVFRRTFLLDFAHLPQTPLERSEALEQLRALEHGYRIMVITTTYDGIGVDTPEDAKRVEALLRAHAETPAP